MLRFILITQMWSEALFMLVLILCCVALKFLFILGLILALSLSCQCAVTVNSHPKCTPAGFCWVMVAKWPIKINDKPLILAEVYRTKWRDPKDSRNVRRNYEQKFGKAILVGAHVDFHALTRAITTVFKPYQKAMREVKPEFNSNFGHSNVTMSV